MLPIVDLIEQCQMACDQLIDMTGRAAIYGRQAGQVLLSGCKLEVERPRLRT
jgi:hypothetical protein